MTKPTISLIAAVARNGVIGRDNALLWRLPSDLKRFRALTMGKPLVIGRKTFLSIGRPLPGRTMVVVTRDPQWRCEGVAVAQDIATALDLARSGGATEICIGGGGEIYAQTLDMADRLFITEVDLAPEGDVHFPAIDPAQWREVSRVVGERAPRDEANFVFVEYTRAR